MERDHCKLRKTLLARLPTGAELEPYLHAIASLKDFASTNDELIAAARLLDDCAILERATVTYLAEGPKGPGKAGIAAVRQVLAGLENQGLAGEWKAQRVTFQRDRAGTVSAHPVSGRLSYWYRTED